MNRRLTALTAFTVGLLTFAAPIPTVSAPSAPIHANPTPMRSIPSDITTQVQFVLKSYGYTIVVDGWYGPQTTKVVKSWQRSNGLVEDGVAGPITQASLGLTPASRVGNAQRVTFSWDGDPRLCTVEQAAILADAFRAHGASDDDIAWFLGIVARESRCQVGAHAVDSDDDSYGICQLNARAGHFGPRGLLAGWDRYRILTDFSYAADACATMWQASGRAPWR